MRFESEAEIDAFMADFEAGTIPKAAWTHQAHLAAAGAYVWKDAGAALTQMRYGILFLNRHHQTVNSADSGYHETLTVFWISLVRDFCRAHRAEGRVAAINRMLAALPASLYREYYSYDVVKSRRARERWAEPDLKRLPDD